MSLHPVVIILVFSLILIVNVAATTLRFRLSSGEMIRLDVDDEKNTTIKQCYLKLVSLGKINKIEKESSSTSSSSKFQIRDKTYQILSETSLESLNLKNGEIINYLSENIHQKSNEIKTSSSTNAIVKDIDSGTSSSSSSSSTTTPPRGNKIKKKTIVSIASIEARKKELEKITRQKSSKLHTVNLNPLSSMERILNRIAIHGGLALLLGHTHSILSKSMTKKISNSATVTKKIILSSTDHDNVMKNVTSIDAICEIFMTKSSLKKSSTSSSSSSNSSSSGSVYIDQVMELNTMFIIQQVMKYANQLGLEIIGCCINNNVPHHPELSSTSTSTSTSGTNSNGGTKTGKGSTATMLKGSSSGNNSNKGSNNQPWSTDHVYTASYLQHLLFHSNNTSNTNSKNTNTSMIILSVSKCGDNGQIQPSSSSSSVTKSSSSSSSSSNKVNVSKASLQNGLSIEAFKLSDQAIRMILKGILPSDRTNIIHTMSIASQSIATNNYQKKNSAISASTSSIDNVSPIGMIQLCSDVVIKNEEVKHVDPLLLAVPLSIVQKIPTSTPTSTGTSTTTTAKLIFQHTFPTPDEINTSSDSQACVLAKKYSTQLLQKLEKHQIGSIRAKLRDIHLFLYLDTLLDIDTVCNIAKCAVDDNINKLPSRSLMAIQMLSLSSKQSSNSNHNDDNDDL